MRSPSVVVRAAPTLDFEGRAGSRRARSVPLLMARWSSRVWHETLPQIDCSVEKMTSVEESKTDEKTREKLKEASGRCSLTLFAPVHTVGSEEQIQSSDS